MPPKQKQQKKGISYRPAVPAKDIVPAVVKEPPREPRPAKTIEVPGDIPKKYEFERQDRVEAWPGNEAARAFDFGVDAAVSFKDPQRDIIRNFLAASRPIIEWKTLEQAERLQQMHREELEQAEEATGEHTRSLHEIKYLDVEPELVSPSTMVMLESFMRDETPEQSERRKKEEAEKAAKQAKEKKKAAKKPEEVKEEGPVKVKDVQLSDVRVHGSMLEEAKWIGSQLQLIKQRNICDIQTQEPIWKKIYPQVQGMPVICRSGRYWVKLYYMGKEVKVEVDDEIPLGSQLQHLFPLSAKPTERWTLIVTKAIIKLLAINNSNAGIYGNGLVLYSLTGLIGERIAVREFTDWDRLGEHLSDRHYTDKDVFVTCYSTPGFTARPPSNIIKAGSQLHKLLEEENSQFDRQSQMVHKRSRSSDRLARGEQPVGIEEEIQSGLMAGYAYYLGDHLFNGNFNMVYAQKMSQREVRLRQQYNELTKVSLNNKSRQDKLEYRKKKKEKRERIHQEEQKRESLLKKSPVPYHFVKVCSDIHVRGDYSVEEIGIAKKCILNDLQYPPNYELPSAAADLRNDDGKSTRSYSLTNKVSKEEKDEMVIRPLEDFSQLPNIVEPLHRPQKGVWIKDQDFLSSFEYLQVFYDPNKLPEKQVCRVDYSVNSEFTVDESKEVLIVEKQQDRATDSVLLFGFAPEYGTQRWLVRPYTMLQKFNFDEFSTIDSSGALEENISCLNLRLSNQNHVFKILTLSRGGYCYWMASNSKLRLTSIASYLTDFEGYTSRTLACDYPTVEAEKYQLYFRLKFDCQEATTALVRLKNIDPYVLKGLRYKLIPASLPAADQQPFEGVHLTKNESTMIVSSYLRIELASNTRYYLLLEGILPFSLPEGSLEVEVFLKSAGATFELVEQVEPQRYLQRYQPNKYGVICRQKLFTNGENVATVYFQLASGEVAGGGSAPATDKKVGKKGGKEEQQPEVAETELKQKRPIRLQLFCGNKLVMSDFGYNETLLSNICLKSTKGADTSAYYIQASFDLREWPEAKQSDEATSKIFWSLKVFSSDSIAVVRDTDKEDQDKEIKRLWEEKEPGRAEKAKKARRRYLLQLKQQAGEQLNQQDLKFLAAPRLTKKQQVEQDRKANEDKKGGKGGKKEEKKPGKDSKKEEAAVKPTEEKLKQLPKSSENVMIEIQDFLKHLEAERVMVEQLHGEPRVRSPADLRSIEEGALMGAQQRVAIIQRNIEDRELTKIYQKEQKEMLGLFTTQRLEEFKKGWQDYAKARNEYFEKSKAKVEKEKVLVDIVRAEKPTLSEADLLKAIAEYELIEGHSKDIVEVLHMVRKNIRVTVTNDRLSAALASFDIDEIGRIDEEIKRDEIEGMTADLLQQMAALQEEARKNPNYILERQSEAKKGKKGKK